MVFLRRQKKTKPEKNSTAGNPPHTAAILRFPLLSQKDEVRDWNKRQRAEGRRVRKFLRDGGGLLIREVLYSGSQPTME
jgi:hypothetical protein